jgi:hypothetical protein
MYRSAARTPFATSTLSHRANIPVDSIGTPQILPDYFFDAHLLICV